MNGRPVSGARETSPAAPPGARPSLARDGAGAVLGAVVSAACNILVILVIARWLGAEAVGHYTIAFAMRAILLLVCGLGTRTAMTRFVAAGVATGDHETVRGAVRAGVAVTGAVALVVAAAWWVLADTLAGDVFGDERLAVPLQLFALSLPAFVFMSAALAATQGFQTMRPYTRIGQVLDPGARLVLTVVALAGGLGLEGASAALVVASVVSAAAAAWSLRRLIRGLPAGGVRTPWGDLATFCGTSWVASMATQGLLWADTIILGVLVTSEEVGAYQVAARVVLLSMLVITPLTASMAPRISYSWETGDTERVSDHYLGTVRWTSRLSFPLLAGMVAVPAALLAVFGSEFGGATWVIYILAAGAVAEVVGAPSGVVLNQIRLNRANMVINLVALTLNVSLNLLLVPRWGIEGAAVAWSLTLAAGAVSRIAVVHRATGLRLTVRRELMVAAVAGVVAGVLATVTGRLLPDLALLQVAGAGLVILLVYPVIVVARGLERAERDQLSRAVSLRLPAVRRWRTQWRLRNAGASVEALDLDRLISPFRIDVLARAELFALAREHADLRATDFESFLERVRGSRYRSWFDAVLVAKGHVTGSRSELEQSFRAIVEASLQLLDRHDQHGGASLGKVTVARVRAGTELDGWSLAEDRWVLLDGGHRISLALLDGKRELEPADYVVEPASMPPNNTLRFLVAGAVTEAEVVDFLARGLVPPERRDRVETWPELLDELSNADNRPLLSQWPALGAPRGEKTSSEATDMDQPSSRVLQGAGGRADVGSRA